MTTLGARAGSTSPELRADGVLSSRPGAGRRCPRPRDRDDDPATRAWSPSLRPLHTEADALAWMARRSREPDRLDWAVRDPATRAAHRPGRACTGSTRSCRSAEIGYGVHPAHRRRGVALPAVAPRSATASTSSAWPGSSWCTRPATSASCAVARCRRASPSRAWSGRASTTATGCCTTCTATPGWPPTRRRGGRGGAGPWTVPDARRGRRCGCGRGREEDAEALLAALGRPADRPLEPAAAAAGPDGRLRMVGLPGDRAGRAATPCAGPWSTPRRRAAGSTGLRGIDPSTTPRRVVLDAARRTRPRRGTRGADCRHRLGLRGARDCTG